MKRRKKTKKKERKTKLEKKRTENDSLINLKKGE